MRKRIFIHLLLISLSIYGSSQAQMQPILPGIEKTEEYFPLLAEKRIAIFSNHTSTFLNGTHLIHTLMENKISLKKIFVPEHGFKGIADAGEHIDNSEVNGIKTISLYGHKVEPSYEDLADIDILIFDIQDVGVRFYTYISSLDYIIKACMKYGKTIILLDRPNPHAHYVDGPTLKSGFESFVGMRPIPVVYGMTIGEYAKMLVGEEWIMPHSSIHKAFNLYVVPCQNYTRNKRFVLPIPPSPNLQTPISILLYPSLCFFEGTEISLGRGTKTPFEVFGHPDLPQNKFSHSFTPQPNIGSKTPPLQGKICQGKKLNQINEVKNLNLSHLLETYLSFPSKKDFFVKDKKTGKYFFDKLAGSDELRNQILKGIPLEKIRQSWEEDKIKFLSIRKKYLIYD